MAAHTFLSFSSPAPPHFSFINSPSLFRWRLSQSPPSTICFLLRVEEIANSRFRREEGRCCAQGLLFVHVVLTFCGVHDAEAKPVLLCSCKDNYLHLYDLPSVNGKEENHLQRSSERRLELSAFDVARSNPKFLFGDASVAIRFTDQTVSGNKAYASVYSTVLLSFSMRSLLPLLPLAVNVSNTYHQFCFVSGISISSVVGLHAAVHIQLFLKAPGLLHVKDHGSQSTSITPKLRCKPTDMVHAQGDDDNTGDDMPLAGAVITKQSTDQGCLY
ncbi:hypothetical protein Bca101_010354 [Brassica carinata]